MYSFIGYSLSSHSLKLLIFPLPFLPPQRFLFSVHLCSSGILFISRNLKPMEWSCFKFLEDSNFSFSSLKIFLYILTSQHIIETHHVLAEFNQPFGEVNGNPLQDFCLENPMDRGSWQATVHGVTRVGHNLAAKQQWKAEIIYSTACVCHQALTTTTWATFVICTPPKKQWQCPLAQQEEERV